MTTEHTNCKSKSPLIQENLNKTGIPNQLSESWVLLYSQKKARHLAHPDMSLYDRHLPSIKDKSQLQLSKGNAWLSIHPLPPKKINTKNKSWTVRINGDKRHSRTFKNIEYIHYIYIPWKYFTDSINSFPRSHHISSTMEVNKHRWRHN